MSFTEVLRLARDRHPVGVLSSAAWVVTTDEPPHYTDLSTSQSLVTVLEAVPSVFFVHLKKCLKELNLEAELVETFPAAAAVRMGLLWPSTYWQEKALQWVQDLEWATKVQTELLSVQENGRSQRVRHWARKLLKTIPRP